MIELSPGRADLHRFELLVAEGDEAFSVGDATTAAAKIADALALWHGPPLADLAFEGFAQHEIARLEELRVSVIEERIAVDLALGRHADIVGELQSLVAANPLRERLREQLMLALYRKRSTSRERLELTGRLAGTHRRTWTRPLAGAPTS